jgi:hypothetical protein
MKRNRNPNDIHQEKKPNNGNYPFYEWFIGFILASFFYQLVENTEHSATHTSSLQISNESGGRNSPYRQTPLRWITPRPKFKQNG